MSTYNYADSITFTKNYFYQPNRDVFAPSLAAVNNPSAYDTIIVDEDITAQDMDIVMEKYLVDRKKSFCPARDNA